MNDAVSSRCGWNVHHGSSVRSQEGLGLVRVSNSGIRFYLPLDLYGDLDDAAFLALCDAKRDAQQRRPKRECG